jgi:DNA-binding GntR family transcriptional regulator
MNSKKNTNIFDFDVKVENLSLSAKVFDILEDKIITGEIPQGTRLVEEDLASMLGVNRGSVREALMLLGEKGLVVRVRNKYTEVKEFSRKDIEDIFYLRLAIEKMAAELCISKNSVPEKGMGIYIEKMEIMKKKEQIDWMDWVRCDLLFHESIVKASDNSLALKIWKSLESQIKTFFYSTFHDYPKNISSKSHKEILGTMIAGNKEKANEAIARHIINGYSDTVKQLSRQDDKAKNYSLDDK